MSPKLMNKFMSQNNDNKTRICLQQKYVSSATAINNENFAQKNKINQNSCKTKKKKEIKVEMTLLFWGRLFINSRHVNHL